MPCGRCSPAAVRSIRHPPGSSKPSPVTCSARPVVAAELEPIGFDEVSDLIPDPVFRRQLVGAAVALGLTIHPSDPAVATRTRELAAALGVDEPLLGAFERSLEGHRYWMMADFARHSWVGDEVQARGEGPTASAPSPSRSLAMKGHGADDEETVARFAELASYPEDSWGRAVSDFYARHHWPLPGQQGSVPMLTTPSRLGPRRVRLRGDADRRAPGERVHGRPDARGHRALDPVLRVEHLRERDDQGAAVTGRGRHDRLRSRRTRTRSPTRCGGGARAASTSSTSTTGRTPVARSSRSAMSSTSVPSASPARTPPPPRRP